MAALLPVALALGGCGFRPLYGSRGNAPGAVELAAVTVGPIADRLGQILRNDLTERLSPLGESFEPRYRLDAKLSESSANDDIAITIPVDIAGTGHGNTKICIRLIAFCLPGR